MLSPTQLWKKRPDRMTHLRVPAMRLLGVYICQLTSVYSLRLGSRLVQSSCVMPHILWQFSTLTNKRSNGISLYGLVNSLYLQFCLANRNTLFNQSISIAYLSTHEGFVGVINCGRTSLCPPAHVFQCISITFGELFILNIK